MNGWIYILHVYFKQPIDSKHPTCMASHSQDNPHTLSTPETSNSPQPEEESFHPEIPYALPHEELNQFMKNHKRICLIDRCVILSSDTSSKKKDK
jgi:hypothetical protein